MVRKMGINMCIKVSNNKSEQEQSNTYHTLFHLTEIHTCKTHRKARVTLECKWIGSCKAAASQIEDNERLCELTGTLLLSTNDL